MANEKTKRSAAAAIHAVVYSFPFLFLTRSPVALLLIAGTHFVIDRFRLARYVVWAKNFLAPRVLTVMPEGTSTPAQCQNCVHCGPAYCRVFKGKRVRNHPWAECSGTGYHKDRPAFLAVWLLIIADNAMHVLLNGLAIRFFG